MSATKTSSKITDIFREEWFLLLGFITVAIFSLKGHSLFADLPDPVGFALIFIWLFAVVLGSCLHVVRHADGLAEIVGEPYGTLILTLSVTTIEVASISAVMLGTVHHRPYRAGDAGDQPVHRPRGLSGSFGGQ